MRKKMIKNICLNIIIILTWTNIVSCNSPEGKSEQDYFRDLSYNYANEVKDTVQSKLFKEVEYLHEIDIQDKSETIFSRVGNEKINHNTTIFQLFHFEYKKGTLPGYWGTRNDSILFIPYHTKECPIEFLIIKWRDNGYYNLDKDNSCFEEQPVFIGDGYSFKMIKQDADYVLFKQFVSPKYIINITEEEYLKDAIFLYIGIDKNKGVLKFQYDYDLEKQPLIPWVKSFVDKEGIISD